MARNELNNCTTYEEWEKISVHIDKLTKADLWRHNFISNRYDYQLIDERLKILQEARANSDYMRIIGIFRSGLLRNFGGISDKELYTRSYAGTKNLIEAYISEVLDSLQFLYDFQDFDTTISNANQLKLNFFHDARQTFGSTALILQGGSLFGLCHLGVIRGLYFKNLLPRVISGSGIGAAVASLVCSLRDDDNELIDNLVNISDLIEDDILYEDPIPSNYGNVIGNVIKKGYSEDMFKFMKHVKRCLGDMTFEEAFLKTDKVLNILLHPTDNSIGNLLNYITAPNVVIWSAICCSIGDGVLYDETKLFVRNLNNKIVPFDSTGTFLSPHQVNKQPRTDYKTNETTFTSHFSTPSPYTRLTELFNINNFVVSLARPYLAPLIGHDLRHSNPRHIETILKTIVSLEVQHRVEFFDKLGLLFKTIKMFSIDAKTPKTKNSSEITIVPQLKTLFQDFSRVFEVDNYKENIPYWVSVGEKSVWPLYPILWTRTAIEFALDDFYNALKRKKEVR